MPFGGMTTNHLKTLVSAEGGGRSNKLILTRKLKKRTFMAADAGYVPPKDCCVSEKQSNLQQTLQRSVCERANGNWSVCVLKFSFLQDGH